MQSRSGASVIAAVVLAIWQSAALAGTGALPTADSSNAEVVRILLGAVDESRGTIVERLVAYHAAAAQANGIDVDTLRTALRAMRADRLLVASLAGSFEELSAIVAQQANEDALPSRGLVVTKDGSGSGANSWIGYTGGGNVASGSGSAVAAGTHNVASGTNSFVGAGTFNAANGQGSFVGAGTSNVANATSALVMGGFDNQATVIDSLVVAGAGNRATGARSVVVGGGYNLASGQWSFVGGGGRQTGSGGAGADATDNVASGDWSAVPGGQGNRATARFGTVSGGSGNTASGDSTTVAGGFANSASGLGAMIAGGGANIASGAYSFAAGSDATADRDGCAVLAFWSTAIPVTCLNTATIVRIGADHGFSVDYHTQRVDGGGTRWVYLGDNLAGSTIATWNGAFLSDAGVWVNASSSQASKTDFASIDPRDVLERVAQLPITTWRYKEGEADVRHIGPMAEDFWNAFHVGYGDHTIADLDARGVALAAIQGLKQALDEKTVTIDALQRRLDAVETLLQELATHARVSAP